VVGVHTPEFSFEHDFDNARKAVADLRAVHPVAVDTRFAIWRAAARLDRANGRIAHRFHARDVNLVMGPAVRGKYVPFRVLLDGRPPGSSHGADVDAGGRGMLSGQRLHQLIRQPGRSSIAASRSKSWSPEPRRSRSRSADPAVRTLRIDSTASIGAFPRASFTRS
jgi:hypothetical protein